MPQNQVPKADIQTRTHAKLATFNQIGDNDKNNGRND